MHDHDDVFPYICCRMDGYCYTEDGRQVPKQLTDQVWDVFCKVEDDLQRYNISSTDEKITLQEHMEKVLKSQLLKFQKSVQMDVRAIFNCMLNYMGFHNGDELNKISLKYCGCFQDITDENIKFPRGFGGVVDVISSEIPDSWLRLEHTVEEIKYGSKTPEAGISIRCRVGDRVQIFPADHVIVTCSLGCLKKHHSTLFSPNLPKYKIDSIQKQGYGTVNKLFLQFKKPFWNPGSGSVKLAWNGDNSEFSPSTWYKHLFAFDEILNNSNVLVGWIHGRAAEYMETLDEEEVKQTCTSILRKFLNRDDLPAPERVLRSAWSSNPYTLGSYSYISVSASDGDTRNIAQPLYINESPAVMFAGEATHNKYYSTTHGARSSGIREAHRLNSLYTAKSRL